MSDLLNDSPTAAKWRDRILAELDSGEQVLFAADANVHQFIGGEEMYLGAVIVTSRRLLVVNERSFGRVSFPSVAWGDVTMSRPNSLDGVTVEWTEPRTGRRKAWRILMWKGKAWKSPKDEKGIYLLRVSIAEARAAVSTSKQADMGDAYEELKRRRES